MGDSCGCRNPLRCARPLAHCMAVLLAVCVYVVFAFCVFGQLMRVVPRLHCQQDREAAWRRYVGCNGQGPEDLDDTVYAVGAVFTINMAAVGLGHLAATRELWTNDQGQWRLGRDLVRKRMDVVGQVLYMCEMEMETRCFQRVRSVQPQR
jgi:hypothetical protein